MIRRVELQDAKAIAAIYNEYVIHSVVTFDIEPVREEDMRGRIAGISAHYPYFVCESDGKVVGYCYAHPWKQRVAYGHTLETTVYLLPDCVGKGITQLMMRLIEECRREGYHALIACLTGNRMKTVLLYILSWDFKKYLILRRLDWEVRALA